jgi:mercuric ion transport protein
MSSNLIAPSPMAARPMRGAGAVLLTLGGFAAAFGVASCCALPFLLTTIGLGTAWLGGIALLAAPHRGFLLAAAAVCLAGGAVLFWRQRQAVACAPGGVCSHPAIRGLTLVGLFAGLVLLYLGYAYA